LGAAEWSWWLALSTALPVYLGIAQRDRRDALAFAERAVESEAREAALLERTRIAREIHDVLGHSLSSIAIQLDMADALHSSGRDDEANVATRQARALAVGSITETRRAIHALREDTLPLPETLKLMASSEKVSFETLGTPGPIAIEAAQTVIRVAQEALTNATKYAPGAARTMSLDFTGDTVSLTVTNEPSSTGHRPEAAGSTGMGLVGMRERAALVGGTLHAGPAGDSPGRCGWTVELEVPK
jgi:signal transduction histidine kinase